MPRENREDIFEKALARHLRASATANPVQPGRACADAETLAAYHEGLLPMEEMALWKGHISECARCQEILAHVEETESITGNFEQEERNTATVPEARPASVREISKTWRAPRWLWTAPAGAIAAGLLVWVVMQEKPLQFPIAKNPPTGVSSTAAPTESVAVLKQAPAKREATVPRPKARSSNSSTMLQQREEPRSREVLGLPGSTSPKAPGAKSGHVGMDQFASMPSAPNLEQPAETGNDKKLEAPRGARAVPAAPPPVAAPMPQMSESVTVNKQSVEISPNPAPAPSPPRGKAATGATAASAATNERMNAAGASGGLRESAPTPSMLLAKSRNPATIVTPDGKMSWRLGARGKIEHSSDGGATWTSQTSGVDTDLFAGSAVSNQVCWVVGQRGTILRTTDGGAHWVKVHAPVEEDFTSVFTVSAQEAIVSDAKATYQTTDGGVSWNKVSAQ